MSFFRDEPDEWQRLDLRLLQNGSAHLYHSPVVLAEDVEQLRSYGYQVDEFDCSGWADERTMHEELAGRLDFPGYYGKNLDALNDCLSEIEVPDDAGRALVFIRYDVFAGASPRVAWHLLDIIDGNSWRTLLFGRRFFALVQSNDARIEFPLIGSRPAMWNPREWSHSSRGL